MKDFLLVTLADEKYLEQAKQVLSSAYYKAGWPGDLMLLACRIPGRHLAWFHERGILVKECEPLFDAETWNSRLPPEALLGTSRHPPVSTAKSLVFTPEFKRWRVIVYLDADIIVRGPLDRLTRVRRFSAVSDYGKALLDQIIDPTWNPTANSAIQAFSERYDLGRESFNTGVFALPTEIIQPETFRRARDLLTQCLPYARYADQLALNFLFYDRWSSLPRVYNYFVYYLTEKQGRKARPEKFNGVVLHFPGLDQRPWLLENRFYSEWIENLANAEHIDATRVVRIAVGQRVAMELHICLAFLQLRISAGVRGLKGFVKKYLAVLHRAWQRRRASIQ